MDHNYISRRKLVKLLKYITNKKINVTIINNRDSSCEWARYCDTYIGFIKKFTVDTYEDAEIKILIDFTNNTSGEIWLSNEYYLYKFDFNDEIIYTHDNGDGTYNDFVIRINNVNKYRFLFLNS